MSFSIAVAGKGGTGKTSLTSLIIRHLTRTANRPILAVDADPNANLGEGLGLEVTETVGLMLDRFQKDKIDIPSGLTKEAYLEFKLNSLLVEKRGFDLLTMGRGEGQGCYCYPNTILRKFIDRLSENYGFVVMDNEAGMEHLSRGTTHDIDELLIVSNHSVKGVRTIGRIKQLVAELRLKIKHQSVVINMAPEKIDPAIEAELDKLGLKADIVIPEDPLICQADLELKSLLDMPENSPAVEAVGRMISKLVLQEIGK
ncbi:MAG TPA: AAA family ATPase [Dehalococcoidales bacterium]